MSSTTGSDFKITFYSTSHDENKSKYPKQMKTSYTVPDGGDTEISFGKPLDMTSRKQTKEFEIKDNSRKTRKERPEEPNGKDNSRKTRKERPEEPNGKDSNMEITSRCGRVSRRPQRYEPVETVTDDFHENEYNSSDSSENST